MALQERLNIAVFIDFDNIEIGVKNTLRQSFDVGTVLEAIKERGEIVSKIAYADWTRAGDYSRSLTQHAIHMVQRTFCHVLSKLITGLPGTRLGQRSLR